MALPNRTGREWLDRYLSAHGPMEFNLLWLAFAIGQTGAAFEFADNDVARELVAQMETDIADLALSMNGLLAAANDLLTNAKATLEGDDTT